MRFVEFFSVLTSSLSLQQPIESILKLNFIVVKLSSAARNDFFKWVIYLRFVFLIGKNPKGFICLFCPSVIEYRSQKLPSSINKVYTVLWESDTRQ